ncbi:MAG: type II toxin-antitoxin system prevent-host-death family antitoxin [Gammaproteobacteria bacterium]|nr:type II toxin-antitoxin system prevent-host-death family antitoxin [Gammaproteobacteria bacterium]
MTTSIMSLSEFKARATQILAEMKSSEQVVVLTQRGAASAVVQDYALSYRTMHRISAYRTRC